MSVLPSEDIDKVHKATMRWWSRLRETTSNFNKAELRAAVVAADAWIDNNSSSFNSALPDPFRSNATQLQKSLLLVATVLMRFGLGMLGRVFQEV